jgi:membrane fusion protein, multidrug efflux system
VKTSLYFGNIRFHLNTLFVVSLLLSMIFTSCKKNKTIKHKPPRVEVIKTHYKNVYEYNSAIGQVVAYDEVNLYARVTGFLEKKNFDDGAFVKKGEILFQIERAQYIAQVKAAEAALRKAEAELRNAKIDYIRNKTLVKTSAVSQKNYDDATSIYQQTTAEVLAMEANLKLQKLFLSYTLVEAPFSGRVGIAPYHPGALVGPQSKPLIHLIKLDPIRVEFVVPESYVVSLIQKRFPGNKKFDPEKKLLVVTKLVPSLILSNGTKYEHTGIINFVNNKIDPSTGTFLMRARFPNPKELLLPGAFVNVNLESKQKFKAILIPQSTIQENQLGKYVLVVNKDNRVIKRSIVTGNVYGKNILIKKGLKPGELIIFYGIQKVRSGVKVKSVLTNTNLEPI